jgi:hypothetical protein
LEALAILLGERAEQIPIGCGDKPHPLAFPVDNQADRHALDPARRKLWPDLSPQEGRHFVPIQPIQDAAGLLSADQILVDLPRVVEGFQDGFFGDLVKHQTPHGNLGIENLTQMPTDRLPFAVFVRRQIQVGGRLQCLLEFLDLLLLVRRDDVNGLEAVVHVDPQIAPFFILKLTGCFFSPLW